MKNFHGKVDQQEFIGSKIEITNAKHTGYKNIAGRVIDETMNTIVIRTGIDSVKVVPKKDNLFKLKSDECTYVLNGNRINNRPEDRIKKSG
ncbi:MAG: ribonuclease P component 1 family protein [Candidatus Saliniplasma sp.]